MLFCQWGVFCMGGRIGVGLELSEIRGRWVNNISICPSQFAEAPLPYQVLERSAASIVLSDSSSWYCHGVSIFLHTKITEQQLQIYEILELLQEFYCPRGKRTTFPCIWGLPSPSELQENAQELFSEQVVVRGSARSVDYSIWAFGPPPSNNCLCAAPVE